MKAILPTAIICLAIGYVLGVFIPCNILPEIEEKPIPRGEFYYYIFTAIGAIATLMTVIVALFKEDIIRLFKKVDLSMTFSNGKALQEKIEDISGTKKAIKYYSTAVIENSGNIHADNCELYIDRIEYTSGNNTEPLLSESKLVKWEGARDRIYISSKGSHTVHLFELSPPQKNSTPEDDNKIIPAELILLGHTKISIEDKVGGEWKCFYSIHSSSMRRPKRFEVCIKWNGEWEHRLTEMSKIFTVELKINE